MQTRPRHDHHHQKNLTPRSNSGLLLVQSHTRLTRGASDQSEVSSILSTETADSATANTADSTEYDSDDDAVNDSILISEDDSSSASNDENRATNTANYANKKKARKKRKRKKNIRFNDDDDDKKHGLDMDDEFDSDSGSSASSSSSDWDANTVISTVSMATTILPQKRKTNRNENIKSYLIEFIEHQQQTTIDLYDDTAPIPGSPPTDTEQTKSAPRLQPVDTNLTALSSIDLTYDLYSMFYPFTNLQSLLFSQQHPYIESDYKKIKEKSPFFKAIMDDEEEEQEEKAHTVAATETKMNWTDIDSIQRIRDLITKLLTSSNASNGIKEEELYLMFSSPSPSEIIEQLRFGVLSTLCDVHMDRFGRRSYHHMRQHQRQRSQIHFYNHSNVPSSIFGETEIVGISDFIEEDIQSEISDADSICSIARIHYHDNDIVMKEVPISVPAPSVSRSVSSGLSNGDDEKIETQIQWQNYAIHSYLYRRTRITNQARSVPYDHSRSTTGSMTSNIPLIVPPAKAAKHTKKKAHKSHKPVSNARNVAEFGVSITPRMYGTARGGKAKHAFNAHALPPLPPSSPQRKHARGSSPWVQDIEKEGFLEKQTNNSVTNVISKQWTRYWAVLWNSDLLLYRKKRSFYSSQSHEKEREKEKEQKNDGNATSNKKLKKKKNKTDSSVPVERIAVDALTLPVETRYDAVNQCYEFKLNCMNTNKYHVFRVKSEFQRSSWVSIIETKINDYGNDEQLTDLNGVPDAARYYKRDDDDKTASCLLM